VELIGHRPVLPLTEDRVVPVRNRAHREPVRPSQPVLMVVSRPADERVRALSPKEIVVARATVEDVAVAGREVEGDPVVTGTAAHCHR